MVSTTTCSSTSTSFPQSAISPLPSSGQRSPPQATHTEIISQGFSDAPGFYVGYDPSHNFRIGDDFRNPPGHLSTGVPFPSDGFLHHYAVTAGSDSRLYIQRGLLVTTFGPISMTPDETIRGWAASSTRTLNSSTAISMTYGFSAARLPLANLHPWRLPVVRERANAAYLGKDYAEAERCVLNNGGRGSTSHPTEDRRTESGLCA